MSSLLAMIAKRKAQTSRIDTLTPKPGRNRYRLLPSWRIAACCPPGVDVAGWVAKFMAASVAGDSAVLMKMAEVAVKTPAGFSTEAKLEWIFGFFADFGQHFIKGQVTAVTVCPSKTHGRPCTVCDEVARGIAQALNMGDKIAQKQIEGMKSSGKVLLNVLDLGGPSPTQVQILALAPSAFNGKKGVGGILSLFTDWPNMLNLAGGADIIIEKSGTGLDTAYGVSAIPSQTNLDLSIMAQLHDLDAFVNQESAESEQRALAGVSAMTGLLPAPGRPSLQSLASASSAFDDVPSFGTAPAAQAPVQQDAAAKPWEGQMDPAMTARFSQQQAIDAATPVQQPVQAVQQPATVGSDALDQLLAGL